MSAMKIKKGDTVKVIAGKDKDKEGKVLAVNAKNNTVIVEGINMITKHAKPSVANQNGGILHQGELRWMLPTLCTFIREKLPESATRWMGTRKSALQNQPARLSIN